MIGDFLHEQKSGEHNGFSHCLGCKDMCINAIVQPDSGLPGQILSWCTAQHTVGLCRLSKQAKQQIQAQALGILVL